MSADNRHIKTEHQSFDEFTEAPDVFNTKKENRESFGADSSNTSEQAGVESPKFIRLRGLPWSATHKEILDFLKGVNVLNGSKGIHLITGRWDGKNTGEAYVEVESLQDVEEARKLNKASMGHRYIEVFTTNPKEAKEAMRKTGGHGGAYVVKLRGLPFAVTAQQIEEFFNGLEIKPDREGILFVMDRRGRATGEAFVQFETQEDTEQALGRNREKIGHRYIEIFRSSMAELKRAANGNGRPGPYDIRERGSNRGGGGGGFNDFPNAGRGNNMRDGWNGQSGANNTLGFNNMPNFTNSGNFGNSFSQNNSNGPNSTGPFPDNNNMGFSNNGHFGNNNNFCNNGNFGQGCNNNNSNNSNSNGPNNQEGRGSFANFNTSLNNNSSNMCGKGSNNMNNFPGNNRFNNGNNGGNNNNNFGNNFGDFNNFGNQRNFMGNNFGGNNMPNNDFPGNRGPGNNHYNNFGNDGPNPGNFNNGPPAIGGNFGPVGGGRGDCELFTIHMRGLPYSSFENDVFKFFDPIRPVNVRINFNKKGLHSGTADAFFDTYEDAQLAMKRHREQMGSRYIELFFDGKTKGSNNSIPYPNNSMGGNNGGNFSRRI